MSSLRLRLGCRRRTSPRNLIKQVVTDLETTTLTPERGEILRLYIPDLIYPSSTFSMMPYWFSLS